MKEKDKEAVTDIKNTGGVFSNNQGATAIAVALYLGLVRIAEAIESKV